MKISVTIIVIALFVFPVASCNTSKNTPAQVEEGNSNDLFVEGWDSEKGLLIGDNSPFKHYWLDSPGGKLVPHKKPDAASEEKHYGSGSTVQISHSGKFTAKTEIKERNSGCCAVLTGENRVIIFETEHPENADVLAAGGEEVKWIIYGWTIDDRSILFYDGSLFLIDVETKKRTDIKPYKNNRIEKLLMVNQGAGFLILYGEGIDHNTNFDYFDISSGKSSLLLSVPGNLSIEDEMILSPDEKTLALFIGTREYTDDSTKLFNRENTLYLLDTLHPEKIRKYKLPEGELKYTRWRQDNTEIAFCVLIKPKTTEIYSIKSTTGELIKWFTPTG